MLTQFGYHLVRLDSRAGDTTQARHILLRIQPSDSSQSKMDREADQLSRIAAGSDNPAKFDEAAKTLGLKPFKIQVTEGEPAIHNGQYVPSVSAWAFGGATPGEVSDLFDSDEGYFIARLDSLTPGGKTFDAVKADVRARLALDRAVERAVPQASDLASAARGTSLEAAAEARKLTAQKTGMATRSGAASSLGSIGEALGAAFSLPVNTVSGPIRQIDGVYVLRVDAKKPADKVAFEAKKKEIRAQRLQQLKQQRLQAYYADLRKQAKVDDRRKEIAARARRQSVT